MSVITGDQYVESLRARKPRVFVEGEQVENIVDHPAFKTGIASCAVTYRAANDPRFQAASRLTSPLIGEEITRWTHIMQGQEDAIAKTRLFRELGDYLCACCYRCITSDVLNAAWATSYDIDQKHRTEYHSRVVEVVREAQRQDWIVAANMVDVRGDRSLPPSRQPDPDVYVRVVEKRGDGIVVRGAKAHSTAAPYTNMLCVLPSGPLKEADKDYAVAFFTPVDAPGITFICRASASPTGPGQMESPISSRFAHAECLTIYEDVFVPWERVFMCGEYEFAGPLLTAFSSGHIMQKCGCRAASMDLNIGAAALIAELNGVERAANIRDYIAEMVMNAEITYACGISAAVQGVRHPSGVYLAKPLPAFAGKVFAARKLGDERFALQDIAGGLVRTLASEKDYRSPATGPYMERYLKTREGTPTEHRIRAFKLIEDLIASDYAGWYSAMAISGGGGPQMMKTATLFQYDLEASKKRARHAAGIA